jgi:hypothetical protein
VALVVCLHNQAAPLLEAVGGFDEGYGFFHGYDRDLSFAVRETGRRCMVVGSNFVDRGGATRAHDLAMASRRAADLAARRRAGARFVRKYRHRLPCDTRSLREPMRDRVRRRAG